MTPQPHPDGPPDGPTLFSAVLTPHRSLGPRGFLILICAVGLISFSAGLAFVIHGAWPVTGFFGLDAALIYFAFKLNYRSGRAFERIDLTDEELVITRVTPSGRSQSWRFNPYWVRVEIDAEPGRAPDLRLTSHGRKLTFGRFLSEDEKLDFAGALRAALATNRQPGIA